MDRMVHGFKSKGFGGTISKLMVPHHGSRKRRHRSMPDERWYMRNAAGRSLGDFWPKWLMGR